MANVLINENVMTDIADAIRSKTGSSATMKASDMSSNILNISGGGSSTPPPSTQDVVILQECTIPFAYNSGLGAYFARDNYCSYMLQDGETYKVTWDGVDYILNAFFAIMTDGSQGIGLGNPAFAGVGENNNAPFLIGVATVSRSYVNMDSSIIQCIYLSATTDSSHTVEITHLNAPYETTETCIFESQTVEFLDQNDNPNIRGTYIEIHPIDYLLRNIKQVVVTWDGVAYRCSVVSSGDEYDYIIGNASMASYVDGMLNFGNQYVNNDLPFCFMYKTGLSVNSNGKQAIVIVTDDFTTYNHTLKVVVKFEDELEKKDLELASIFSRACASVTLPDTVINVGEYMFSNCYGLLTIQFNDNCEMISAYAFKGCINLKLEELPASIKLINSYVFQGCTKITTLTLKSTPNYIAEHAFEGSSITTLNVPWAEGTVVGDFTPTRDDGVEMTVNYNYTG